MGWAGPLTYQCRGWETFSASADCVADYRGKAAGWEKAWQINEQMPGGNDPEEPGFHSPSRAVAAVYLSHEYPAVLEERRLFTMSGIPATICSGSLLVKYYIRLGSYVQDDSGND